MPNTIQQTQHACEQIKHACEQIISNSNTDLSPLETHWETLNQLQMKAQIDIASVDFTGQSGPADEYVALINRGNMHWDISNWHVMAGSPDQRYTFPPHSLLHPEETIRIYTDRAGEHSFKSKRPIWNNRGDTATLLNDQEEVISSWVYGRDAHALIVISHVQYDGQEHGTEGDEFVELMNTSDQHIADLGQWRLINPKTEHTFIFPTGTTIAPMKRIRVYTNRALLAPDEFSFDHPRAIWNNKGGCCQLLDYQERLVSEYSY